MSESIAEVKVREGKSVAGGIELYVNSFGNPGKAFYDDMLKKSVNIQHNFTILCLDWFKALANTKYFDKRNEASVEYARSIAEVIKYEQTVMRKASSRGVEDIFLFDYRSDESAAELLEWYLRTTENNEAFVKELLRAHRTNQQSFSRLCCEWFKVLSNISARRKHYVVLARKAVKSYKKFPLV